MDETTFPFMIQRFRANQNISVDTWKETFKALAEHPEAADEVWFSTGIGFPEMAWHREHSARLAQAAEDLRSIGVLPSLEIQAIIGHGDSITRFCDDMSGKTWRGWTGSDGKEAEACSCPRDPELIRYFREVGKIYAAWHPASLWFDDDVAVRSRIEGTPWSESCRRPGCWCERCVGDFAKRTGRAWTRETLAAAVVADKGIQEAWFEFSFDSLADLVGEIATAVHDVSPETVFGYQHGYVSFGRDLQLKIYKRLFDISGHNVRSRPGGGAYCDHDAYSLIEKAYAEARQIRALEGAEYIEAYCPEIESCPRTFACKTVRGIEAEAFMSLTQGMNSLSFFIADGEYEKPAWYGETLFGPLASSRGFFEKYVALNKGALVAGLDMPFASPTYYAPHLGIPLCCTKGYGTGTILRPEALTEMTDDELAEVLRGNVLLEGVTAMMLVERGFAKALAGIDIRPMNGIVREYFTDDPLNAGLEGGCNNGGGSTSFRMTFADPTAKVRVLAQIRPFDGTAIGDSTCLVERADGTCFAVLGVGLFDGEATSLRRLLQLHRIADRVSGETLPAVMETPALIVTFPRTEADGAFRTMGFLNPRIEPSPDSLRFRIRGVPKDAAFLVWYGIDDYDERCESASLLSIEWDGDDAIVELPSIEPWRFGYLALE